MPSLVCIKPFRRAGGEFRCGQCMPCRIFRGMVLKGRLLLEASQHRASFFLTLTYSPDHLPRDKCVSVATMQDFFKRLRYYNPGVSLRYFYVGEYGSVSLRPHYHAIVFGDITRESVAKAWPFGFVHVGLVTPESAGYVCGYVLKSKRSIPENLTPEFARWSRNPALAKGVGVAVGQMMVGSEKGLDLLKALDFDAPAVIRQGGKVYPLGRYMRNVIRRELGFEPKEPPHRALKRQQEVREPLDRARAGEQAAAVFRLQSSKRYL